MTYFKINNHDYSKYVNKLKVAAEHIYTEQTSVMGSNRVEYKGTRHIIEVGIIPLNIEDITALQADLNLFNVTISYLNPETGELKENMNCYIPSHLVEYYSIYADNVKLKAFSIEFRELVDMRGA